MCGKKMGWHPTALNAVLLGLDTGFTCTEHIVRGERVTVSSSFKFGVFGEYH